MGRALQKVTHSQSPSSNRNSRFVFDWGDIRKKGNVNQPPISTSKKGLDSPNERKEVAASAQVFHMPRSLKSEIESLRSRLRAYEGALNEYAKVESKIDQFKDLINSFSDTRSKVELLIEDNARLSELLEDSSSYIEELESQNAELKIRADPAQFQRLTTANEMLTRERDALTLQISEFQHLVSNQVQEISAIKARLRDSERDSEECRRELQAVQTRVLSLESAREALNTLEEKNKAMEVELTDVRTAFELVEAEMTRLTDENSRLEKGASNEERHLKTAEGIILVDALERVKTLLISAGCPISPQTSLAQAVDLVLRERTELRDRLEVCERQFSALSLKYRDLESTLESGNRQFSEEIISLNRVLTLTKPRRVKGSQRSELEPPPSTRASTGRKTSDESMSGYLRSLVAEYESRLQRLLEERNIARDAQRKSEDRRPLEMVRQLQVELEDIRSRYHFELQEHQRTRVVAEKLINRVSVLEHELEFLRRGSDGRVEVREVQPILQVPSSTIEQTVKDLQELIRRTEDERKLLETQFAELAEAKARLEQKQKEMQETYIRKDSSAETKGTLSLE